MPAVYSDRLASLQRTCAPALNMRPGVTHAVSLCAFCAQCLDVPGMAGVAVISTGFQLPGHPQACSRFC